MKRKIVLVEQNFLQGTVLLTVLLNQIFTLGIQPVPVIECLSLTVKGHPDTGQEYV